MVDCKRETRNKQNHYFLLEALLERVPLSTELQIENTCRALRHLHTLNTQSEEGGVYLMSLILIHDQSLALQNLI